MNFKQANRRLRLAAFILACGTSSWAVSQKVNPSDMVRLPQEQTVASKKEGWASSLFSVASAHPLATQAGYEVLKEGGSAVDAAVAIQMVLTLVEPQSSGIGGGAFLLHHDGHRVEAYDGRETAPAGATENLFINAQGQVLSFKDGVASGLSVGVPGTLSVLELAHKEHGKLAWSRLIQPAIDLALHGFKISPRLHAALLETPELKSDADASRYFFNAKGKPHPVGHLLKNPELAMLFKAISAQGSRALKEGPWAQALVNKVQGHPLRPGSMTLQDLATYKALKRPPMCFDFLAKLAAKTYQVCGFPPPSSGALAMGQILGVMGLTPAIDLPLEHGLPSSEWLHFYNESAKLAFADRAQFVADPNFVTAPGGQWLSLLAPSYLQQRRLNIGPRSMPVAKAGQPVAEPLSWAPMPFQTEYGTSHLSIMDSFGQTLAMTTSIEASFGAKMMVNSGTGKLGGFMLNNELTDFSFIPQGAHGLPVANRVEPGKRPRSSMSPTLVFDGANKQLKLSGGSPGGAAIIHYSTKFIWATLNWGLNVQEAIDLPNFSNFNGPAYLEDKRFPAHILQELQNKGHEVNELPMPSGIQAIEVTPSGFFGGADPRREGLVMGPKP
jgi:gamma-glutamyltranspeptidase/glutathione hydrolase